MKGKIVRNRLQPFLLAGLLVYLPVLLNGQSTQGYEFRFKIDLKDTLCHIANYYGEKQYLVDSAKTDSKGLVVFKGKEKKQGGIYLFVFPNKTYFEFLVDKEQHFTIECTSTDPVNNMTVKGSQDNSNFINYLKFIQKKSKEVEPLRAARKAKTEAKESTDSLDALIKVIDKSVIDYKLDFIGKNQGNFLSAIFKASQEIEVPEAPLLANGRKDSTFAYRYYRQHYWDNFDIADERLLRTPLYHNKLQTFIKNIIPQIPDTIIKEADILIEKARANKETFKYLVWYITNTYETSNIMGLDAVFVHMGLNYYTKEQAYWVDEVTLFKIRDRAAQLDPILLGRKVKNLILEDTSGRYQALYNVTTPWTILFFWDPDCGHCKKTVPPLQEYYNKVKSKGVEIYAICTEVEMDKWRNYIKEQKLEWINVADPKLHNNFRHEFDISTTPQIFLLDKNKQIKAKKIDVETLEKILNNELEKS